MDSPGLDQVQRDTVIACAALAPSVHNTQPWHFTATEERLEVHADRRRQLQFLDPDGRQLHLSCGAAVEFARLAIRDAGRAVDVRLLPDAADPDHLADLVVGAPEPASPDERRLAAAMPRRYTDRGPYADQPVPADVLAKLRAAAAASGAWLRVVDRHQDRLALVALLEEAEAAEATHPGYAEELSQWVHERREDGIPVDAVTTPWPETVVSDVPLRDFSGAARHRHPGPDAPPRVERDTVIVVGTSSDGPEAWLGAGRALADVLLLATAADLTAQPLGPVTDFPRFRTRLRHELRLVGHPQLALRIGYGQDRPHTSRLPAEGVDTAH